jgi:hypothetical protein
LSMETAVGSFTDAQLTCSPPQKGLRCALSARPSSSELNCAPTTPARTSSSKPSSSAMTCPTLSSCSAR